MRLQQSGIDGDETDLFEEVRRFIVRKALLHAIRDVVPDRHLRN